MRTLILPLFGLLALGCTGNAQPGPMPVGHLTLTAVDSARSNRSVPLEVYYPAQTVGSGAPMVAGSYPVLAFGHGFVMAWSAYENLWEEIVPQGYIMAFPRTETGFSPDHAAFAADLAFAIRYLKQLGNTPGSHFYGHVSGTSAVMGHSMGGGASILAAASDSTISAVLNFAAAETGPSAIAAAASIVRPVLMLAGSNDCVTPPAQHQVPIYQALAASPCRVFLAVAGGSHCQFNLPNLACDFGEATCTPAPAITREQQHQVAYRYVVPWLNAVLKGDCSAWNQRILDMPTDADISFELDCDTCAVTGTTGPGTGSRGHLRVYPNPAGEYVQVATANFDGPIIIALIDKFGRVLQRQEGESGLPMGINLQGLAPGGYLIWAEGIGTVGYEVVMKR